VSTGTFGKLFSCTVDGAVYAQPLWVANLTVGGAVHNVLFVATQHNSLYAFDADSSPCTLLWQASLLDASHGANAGETTFTSGPSITPEVGVTGTPVFDPTSGTLYVVSKSMLVVGGAIGAYYYQRLHAIDATTGNERTGSPVTIALSYPGTGDGSSTTAFQPRQQLQRAGLALVNGTVYIAWASVEDGIPYYGWIAGYTYAAGGFNANPIVLNVTPNTQRGGSWMSGNAPAVDGNGHLYVITGNGDFDVTNSGPPNNDYGDCFLQLSPGLTITSWFAPSDQAADNTNDNDFGAGGAAVVLNVNSGPVQHLVIGGGKDGTLYLLNGDNMGGLGDNHAWQAFNIGHGIFASGAFWNGTLYLAPVGGQMLAYAFNAGSNTFNTIPASQSNTAYGFPGATPSVSASGSSSNGIVWGIDATNYCTPDSPACGPAVLHAYDATNLTELWNSSIVAGDAAGNAVKFTVPTIANGKVYVGTRGNNTGGVYGSTSVSGEVDVYGLKPN